MTTLAKLTSYALLCALPALARPAVLVAQADEPASQTTPQSPQPTAPPPAPPAATPAPPTGSPAPTAQVAAPQGQWVYTQQYGWIWMPYGDAYAYAPPEGSGEPLAYVYYPSFGWRWVVAPWVWGIGPWPYFGTFGPRHFAWYAHGWWRTPARWHFRPAPVREGLAVRGIRPEPRPVRPAPVHGRPGGHFEREHRGERR